MGKRNWLTASLTAALTVAAAATFLFMAPATAFAQCSSGQCAYGVGCYSTGACVMTACNNPDFRQKCDDGSFGDCARCIPAI